MTDREAITQRLRQANESVAAADLPEHLQGEAFRLAFEALGQPAVVAPAGDVGTQSKKGKSENAASKRNGGVDSPAITQDAFFEQLSLASGVDEATLRDVYHLDAGKVGLNLRGQDLGDSMKARVISISTLLAGACRLGLGSELSSSDARAVAKTFQSLDRNFADHVRSNPNVTYKGPTKRKVLDLRAGKEENYKEFVESLVD